MKKIKNLTLVICVIVLCFTACKKDNTQPTPTSSYKGKQIISFSIVSPAETGAIDTVSKTITISVPQGTNLTSLTTAIVLPTGVSISPASGIAQNFSSTVTYTVTLPDKSTSKWVVNVQAIAAVTINQNITQSVTWTADKVYVIDGDVYISNSAVLTIAPGTLIEFNAGASLTIGYSDNATLIADGTAILPITFTSSSSMPATGAWNGIYFYDNTLSNSTMSYCNILYAGSKSSYGALNLLGCDLAIDHCNIKYSGSDGIYTSYNSSKGGFTAFTNNTIANATNYAIEINAQKVSTIGDGNAILNTKGVHIFGNFTSNSSQTWRNLGTPYIITDWVYIDGVLTLQAGSTFKFGSDGGFTFGYNDNTSLTAVGTTEFPITFTSNSSSPAAGAWKGVFFYSSTLSNSKVSNCIFDYTGSNSSYAAVNVYGCSFTFTNNIIRNCSSYGMDVEEALGGFVAFNNNSISATNSLLKISALHVPDLGIPNTFIAAAGKGIEVYNGSASYSTPVTWKKQTADFYLTGGPFYLDGTITFEAGTNFYLDGSGWIGFGYNASTTLTANGTSTSPITFTSSISTPASGSWYGIRFYNNTLSNTTLNYCNLNYAGKNNYNALEADVSMTVSNCQINNCASAQVAGYSNGIIVSGSGNNFIWTKL